MNFNPFDAFFLLPAMIVLQQLGHGLRLRRQTAPQSSAVEGAVFALFGLLLAFTFSGAVARYDAHRELVTRSATTLRLPISVWICCQRKIKPGCANSSATTWTPVSTFTMARRRRSRPRQSS